MIKTAAIIVDNKMFTGYSHSDIIRDIPPGLDIDNRVEGFLTDKGTFLDRIRAFDHAKKCEQLSTLYEGKEYGSLRSNMLSLPGD